jgi:hypothetical protein
MKPPSAGKPPYARWLKCFSERTMVERSHIRWLFFPWSFGAIVAA